MKPFRGFVEKIRHMRIVQKLIVGYVLLICIPFAIFSYLFYTRMTDHLLDQYRSDQVQFAEQAYRNFEIELSKVESVYSLFQNNNKLIEYLSGFYTTDLEMIYNYLREIQPTFSFAYLGNPNIEDIRIYKHDTTTLQLKPDIVNMEDLPEMPVREAMLSLPPNRGLWTVGPNSTSEIPVLYYTQKLYNDTYTRELGLLQITANRNLFDTLFQTLYKNSSWKGVFARDGRPVYLEPIPGWERSDYQEIVARSPEQGVRSFFVRDRRFLANVIVLDKLGLTLLDVSEMEPIAHLKPVRGWIVGGGFLLLILLSLIYFMVASSITLRIIRFTRHLKRVPELKSAAFPGATGSDEIGFLITSYNAMITRMEEMAQRVHRTELLKKEAEIKMLQAQIKPHFLYNTLETMRMMAMMKNEDELAEVAFTLGNLIRYSLSKSGDETTLQDEVDNVRNYIAIHKVRMGDRLQFELQVEGDISKIPCPRFILQPIVENSILHGLGQMRRRGIIRLHIRNQPDQIRIMIYNNGALIPPDKLASIRNMLEHSSSPKRDSESHNGIGLINVQERIRAFFGERSGITVESGERTGTIFELHLEKGRGGAEHVEIDDCG